MENRIRNNATGDARNEANINAPRHPLRTSRKSRSPEKNDDVILSLAEAYENRRAQQVGEWERLYGQNVYRGA